MGQLVSLLWIQLHLNNELTKEIEAVYVAAEIRLIWVINSSGSIFRVKADSLG